MSRRLIVNADDFGLCAGVNAGVVLAARHGIVTSASLMVRGPAAEDAVRAARDLPGLSLGLHLDLSEWAHDGTQWRPLYEVVDTGDATAVAAELNRQLAAFARLAGRPPTHLDSHQHVHRSEPVAALVAAAGARLGVPVRDVDVPYRGDFYGQSGKGEPYPEGITVPALCGVVAGLPEGVTELGCHPGLTWDLDSVYRDERQQEVAVLCDPAVRAALRTADVELVSMYRWER